MTQTWGRNTNRERNHWLLECEEPGVIDSVMFGKYTVTCGMLQFNQLSSWFGGSVFQRKNHLRPNLLLPVICQIFIPHEGQDGFSRWINVLHNHCWWLLMKWIATMVILNFLHFRIRSTGNGIILCYYNIIVYRMEFDKIRWSCPWNSDQDCTQNSARDWWGLGLGVGGGHGWRR